MRTSAGAPEHLLTAHDRAPDPIGREREPAALREMVAGHRLVTVTGAAGMGKTGMGKSRLAAAATNAPAHDPAPQRPPLCVVRVRWHGGEPAGSGTLAAAVLRAARPGRGRVRPGDGARRRGDRRASARRTARRAPCATPASATTPGPRSWPGTP